jgi:hypothetical protein
MLPNESIPPILTVLREQVLIGHLPRTHISTQNSKPRQLALSNLLTNQYIFSVPIPQTV